jgi:hypothetical protein
MFVDAGELHGQVVRVLPIVERSSGEALAALQQQRVAARRHRPRLEAGRRAQAEPAGT